jgi:hypothetical protein
MYVDTDVYKQENLLSTTIIIIVIIMRGCLADWGGHGSCLDVLYRTGLGRSIPSVSVVVSELIYPGSMPRGASHHSLPLNQIGFFPPELLRVYVC